MGSLPNRRRTVIVPRVRCPAWHGDRSNTPPTYEVADVETALKGRYDGEACMTAYAPPDGDECPRLAKASLATFLSHDDLDEPEVGVIPVDIDYADHEVPPDGWAESVVERVEWPCGWYRTPHGLRLVFYPKEKVRLGLAESYIAWVYRHLDEWGIEADQAATDWTRLFKLPHALGRDLPYDYSNLEPIEAHPDDLDEADPSSVGAIVDRDGAPTDTKTLTKTYLSPISDSHLKERLVDGRLSAPQGQRHDKFLKTASTIARAYDTADPEVPYEILFPSWKGYDDKRAAELWRMCEWACAQYQGAKEDREAEKEDIYERTAETMDVDSKREVRERVIIDTGAQQYVFDEEAQAYSTPYTHQHQLLGALRRHAPRLASQPIADRWSREETMAYYSTVAEKVVYTYGGQAGYDETTATIYRRVCEPDPRLTPTRHVDVEEWIEAMAGDRVDELKRWLASVPRLDRPLCGLYLHGPPSIGKQLFALGLARIWSDATEYTPYSEMVGDWNSSLKDSPLVWADEKVPQDTFSENDSSVLRRVIGNDSIRVREKHKSAATLKGYPRVLITANNQDALAIREELDKDDLEAIKIRLGYVATDSSPKRVLERLADDAGYSSTREYTESWVAGGKLAEYVLWLADNYEFEPDNRLLVEGWESDLTRDLPTRVGSAADIAEAIAVAVVTDTNIKGLDWHGDYFYVNSRLLGEHWSNLMRAHADKPPNSQQRAKALRAISEGSTRRRVDNGSRLRFWKVPAERVASMAGRRGVCDPVEIIEAASREESPKTTNVTEVEPEPQT